MASVVTNKGKAKLLQYLRGVAIDTNLYLALCTSTTTPTADTDTFSDLTEVPAGNGYTSGGVQLTPNTTDFDSLTENDTSDRAELQLRDITAVTASGGDVTGIRYAVLTDDNATVADREVYVVWDIAGLDLTVYDGDSLILQDFELRLA